MANTWRAAPVNRLITGLAVCVAVAVGAALVLGEAGSSAPLADLTANDVADAFYERTQNGQPSRLEATTAADLGVTLDQDGRPFNSPISGFASRPEVLGTIELPDAAVTAVDGFYLVTGDSYWKRDVEFNLEGVTEATVTMLWQLPTDAELQEPLFIESGGVRLDIEDRTVARWEPIPAEFPFTFGGFTSGRELTPDGDTSDDGIVPWRDHIYVGDHDAHPGDDTVVVFGSENATFDPFVGYAANGTVASVLMFDTHFPWRLTIFDGTPPASVTEREDEFLECMAGVRPISGNAFCMPGQLDELLEELRNPTPPSTVDPIDPADPAAIIEALRQESESE